MNLVVIKYISMSNRDRVPMTKCVDNSRSFTRQWLTNGGNTRCSKRTSDRLQKPDGFARSGHVYVRRPFPTALFYCRVQRVLCQNARSPAISRGGGLVRADYAGVARAFDSDRLLSEPGGGGEPRFGSPDEWSFGRRGVSV